MIWSYQRPILPVHDELFGETQQQIVFGFLGTVPFVMWFHQSLFAMPRDHSMYA